MNNYKEKISYFMQYDKFKDEYRNIFYTYGQKGFDWAEKKKFETILDIDKGCNKYWFDLDIDILNVLLKELFTSGRESTVEQLWIYSRQGRSLEATVELLKTFDLANLKVLKLGEHDVTYEYSAMVTGHIGDLTGLFAKMPRLEELELYGSWDLEEELNLENLKYLELFQGYNSIGGCIIKQGSFEKLLTSRFTNIEGIEVEIGSGECIGGLWQGRSYTIPSSFFERLNMSKLKNASFRGVFLRNERVLEGYCDGIIEVE